MRLGMLLFIAALLLGCAESPIESRIDTIRPEINKVQVQRIADMGRFVRAVKLEATDTSLLGNIETVKVDARTGDLVVADLKASKAIYRFDAQGRYLCGYGRPGAGPGEYDAPLDFTILDDGTVVLLTSYKLLAFDPSGAFQRETRLKITGLRVTHFQNQLLVYGLKPQGSAQVLWLYDQNLKGAGSLHVEDPHLRQLMFMPREIMTANGKNLFVGEPFQGAFSIYEPGLSRGRKCLLPSENDATALASAWQGFDPRNDASAQRIGKQIHRLENLHTFAGMLHFTEIARGGEIFRTNVYDPEQNILYRFGPAKLIMPGPNTIDLGLDAIVGSDAQGIIGVLYDPEKFERYKHSYPALQQHSFADTDNPLLLFFQYHLPHSMQSKEVSP